ncbi:helix-turn-helix transcriptional regulator [Psychrobacter sp. W2-37-MNA-CIBAN-0211]|uniref:helix-turn-helix transcriptional regulator n=1 Tax=Psychrobacter sp. W2-37-MNA-CIBAN-0211 TaxID=3140443 RepID=UPI00332756FD
MAKQTGYTKRDLKKINVIMGANLKAARKNAGMTQKDVMQEIWGVSTRSNRISEIENGKKDLSVVDLLVFQRIYGQSVDYICGLSCEPEIDMLAGTANHIVSLSHNLIETVTTKFSEVLIEHMKVICKSDHEALVDRSKALCHAVKSEYSERDVSPVVGRATNDVMQVMRVIETKKTLQSKKVETQMVQIMERMDKLDGHRLIRERDEPYQYSMALPCPDMMDVVDNMIVGAGKEDDARFIGVSYE